MKTNLLETKTVTFREIMGNGKKYIVPLYQRDYSWREEHWEDLWLDIESLKNKEDIHYLGSVVLKGEEDKLFTIIDGQQRFITLSIIILAGLKKIKDLIDKNIEPEHNKQRIEILMNTFLGNRDAVSLTYASKLKLNEHNNDFYQSYLLQLNLPLNSGKLNDSNKLMLKAFQYFYDKIDNSSELNSGENISKFIETTLGDKILFIQITVEDDISAYTVFETLNARGLELTATDLLKNYLFSLIKSSIDLENLNRQWEVIVNTIGVSHLPKFLRYFLNSRQKLIRTDRLFKEIKSQITKTEQVFPLLSEMEKYADLYTALSDYENDLWKNNKEIRQLIREIDLFNVEQHKSLLMVSYFFLEESEFIKVLRIIRAIVFRYTVISGLNPNNLEDVYNRASIKIFKKEITSVSEIFKELKPVYLTDEDFKNNFSTKTFVLNSKTKKLVKYILGNIENQSYSKEYNTLDMDATIEHIFPENPSEGWEAYFKKEESDLALNRLGNLALLEDKLNSREVSNKLFEEKKIIYQRSSYETTRELCRYDQWSMDEIRQRQKKLAEIAATIWKADY